VTPETAAALGLKTEGEKSGSQETRCWRKADSNRWSHFDRDAFQNTILGPELHTVSKIDLLRPEGRPMFRIPFPPAVSHRKPRSSRRTSTPRQVFGDTLDIRNRRRACLGDRSTEMDNGEQSGSTLPARMRFSIDGWDASLPLIPREAD
jgi:hypothetical protein